MKGFLILDVVVGLFLISLVAALAFWFVSNQKNLLNKAYEMDLARRTAVNLLARRLVKAEEDVLQMNGFEIECTNDTIDLRSSEKVYRYRVGDDTN
ncbi:hypothetical protein ACSFC1_07035 [Pseudothermotoga sp. U03pept]|uniref:hypothetical protein n=1 Tax=Pseudothermotoga sp. U03pept TaxID=3447012 RepID=UPI003F10A81C